MTLLFSALIERKLSKLVLVPPHARLMSNHTVPSKVTSKSCWHISLTCCALLSMLLSTEPVINTVCFCCFCQGSGPTQEEEIQEERYPSAVPFLPPLSASTVKYYYQFYAFAVGTIILFGGLLSPALEVNLGLGGSHASSSP